MISEQGYQARHPKFSDVFKLATRRDTIIRSNVFGAYQCRVSAASPPIPELKSPDVRSWVQSRHGHFSPRDTALAKNREYGTTGCCSAPRAFHAALGPACGGTSRRRRQIFFLRRWSARMGPKGRYRPPDVWKNFRYALRLMARKAHGGAQGRP